MVKSNLEILSDDLIADSLQVENYLKQSSASKLSVVCLGMEQIQDYLERLEAASINLQFKVFLFSSFYARKLERHLEEMRGDEYG